MQPDAVQTDNSGCLDPTANQTAQENKPLEARSSFQAQPNTKPPREKPQKPSANSVTLTPPFYHFPPKPQTTISPKTSTRFNSRISILHSHFAPRQSFSQKMASIPHLSCKSSTRPKSPPRMRPGRPLTVICKYHSGHKEDSCRCRHRKEASEAGRPADRFPGTESSPSPIL